MEEGARQGTRHLGRVAAPQRWERTHRSSMPAPWHHAAPFNNATGQQKYSQVTMVPLKLTKRNSECRRGLPSNHARNLICETKGTKGGFSFSTMPRRQEGEARGASLLLCAKRPSGARAGRRMVGPPANRKAPRPSCSTLP